MNKSKLNVLHPDSPYGLIQNVIAPNLPKNKPVGNQRVSELGGLAPDDIWLSEGNLLVLKGGTTPFKTNSIQGPPETTLYSQAPSLQVTGDFYQDDDVTYSDSGKLAIAPAPPQIASIYVNNLHSISLNNKVKSSKPTQVRTPKHIGNLVPFVPKNTQIPWPKGGQTTLSNNNALLKPPASNAGLHPVQNAFKPSAQIATQNGYIPKINQYTVPSNNPSYYQKAVTAVNAVRQSNDVRQSKLPAAYHSPSNLVIQSTVSPFYPVAPTWSLSPVISPTATPILNAFNGNSNNNNRKSFNQNQAGIRNNYPQHRHPVNPLLEYLKKYSAQKLKPVYHQQLQTNGVGITRTRSPSKNIQHRTPKAYSKIRKQIFPYHNNNRPYVNRRHTSVVKDTPREFSPQGLRKHSNNYIKKKTKFLDYLTYIKPYLPSVLSNES